METLYVALWEAEKPMFKSYYVVWKPKWKEILKKIEKSLNRTM